MLIPFTSSSFSLIQAANNVKALINASTNLTFQQKSDCIEVLLSIADETFEPGRYTIDKSIIAIGANGYKVYVVYFASQNYDRDLLEASITLTIDVTADSTSTVTPATSTVTVPTITATAWVPPTPPTLPAQGSLEANFASLQGISVILPDVLASIDTNNLQTFLNFHVLAGYAVTSSASGYVKAAVTNGLTGDIPNYTLATLYYNNTPVTSGYSTTGAMLTGINLYYNVPSTGSLSLVIQTSGVDPWIVNSKIECFGNVRFSNGSVRGLVIGASAVSAYPGSYDMAFSASGCVPGTYISEANFVNALDTTQYLNTGRNFHYNFNGNLSSNPLYGHVQTSNIFTGTGGADNAAIYDALIQVNVTVPLTASTIPFKIYTPYTFALTGSPIWIQTVLPDSNNHGVILINWGDNTTSTYVNTLSTELYALHAYNTAGTYTAVVSGFAGPVMTTASATFIVVDNYSTLDINDYAETLDTNLKLPYSKEEVDVGSNEWAVADNINAAIDKLKDNFNYLNNITDSIRKTPDFSLTGWLRDLVAYPTWNTALTGSSAYFTLSGSYAGIIPAESIIDFKSYKNNLGAPDYYNYIAYNNGLVQIRKNNYNNTLVNQITAITSNAEPLFVYGVDANDTDLYLLASLNQGGGRSAASVYRYSLKEQSLVAPINQVGGGSGTKEDNNNFSITQPPSGIKVYKDNVYIADAGNKCIKVYNSALTHINTIYSNELNAYNVLQFDINSVNGETYILGRIVAPNSPVITSVTSTPAEGGTVYKVTFNHDGERLNQTQGATTNFNVYGLVNNNEDYTFIESISSGLVSAVEPKLTTYIKSTDVNYTSFKVQAIGYDGVVLSERSSSKVVPNYVKFPSPYKLFVYNTSSQLVSTLSIPDVPSTATIKKIVIDPIGTFLYVITKNYIYKYTVNGVFVNKIASPSTTSDSLGTFEDIITGFIDSSYYLYIVTNKRIYKFTDIPFTEQIVNKNLLQNYYTNNSAINVDSNEFITDWVYNKALEPLLYNHELLAKCVNKKYVITLDGNKDLVDFTVRNLSANELINSVSASNSNFVYSNEIVSSAVVNRTINQIYNIQETILDVLTPEIVNIPPSASVNVLGKITAASSIQVSGYVPPVPPVPPTPTPEPLPDLFTFYSAQYFGNLYSDLYGKGSRYGNDYNITFSLINALSSTQLNVLLLNGAVDLSAALTTPFDSTINLLVKQNDNIIYSANSINPTNEIVSISEDLADSSTIAADGSAGTFGASFEISLSVGAVTNPTTIKPLVLVIPSSGRLYNTTFKNGLSGTLFPSCYVKVNNISGSNIPYVGITNNTLGGYLYSNPYSQHTWSIDGTLSAVNPSINVTPTSSYSFTLSAARLTDGETEVVLGLNRKVIEPADTPSYLLTLVTTSTTTNTGAVGKPGGGYVNGTGYYPAGTVVPVFAVATYGTFGRFSQNVATPPYGILVSGAGTNSNWVTGPTFTGNTAADAGGRVDGSLFVESNKTVDVAFYHS